MSLPAVVPAIVVPDGWVCYNRQGNHAEPVGFVQLRMVELEEFCPHVLVDDHNNCWRIMPGWWWNWKEGEWRAVMVSADELEHHYVGYRPAGQFWPVLDPPDESRLMLYFRPAAQESL